MEKNIQEILQNQKSLERVMETKFHDMDVKEPLHVVAPSQHEDADVDIENPLENDILVDSVASSSVCLASNIVPNVFRMEPHVNVLSEDVAVVRTVENPDNANVDRVGQCNEVVVVSSNLVEKLFWLFLKNNNMKNLTVKASVLFRTV
ncbi:hypothetical protein D1007_09619 [Hordeum vulgare]|nr:hypothetical protein D1007_09619 [Hordeum vulgare]